MATIEAAMGNSGMPVVEDSTGSLTRVRLKQKVMSEDVLHGSRVGYRVGLKVAIPLVPSVKDTRSRALMSAIGKLGAPLSSGTHVLPDSLSVSE